MVLGAEVTGVVLGPAVGAGVAVVGAIGAAVGGTTTGGRVGAAVGAVVGTAVGSGVGKEATGARVGAGVGSGVGVVSGSGVGLGVAPAASPPDGATSLPCHDPTSAHARPWAQQLMKLMMTFISCLIMSMLTNTHAWCRRYESGFTDRDARDCEAEGITANPKTPAEGKLPARPTSTDTKTLLLARSIFSAAMLPVFDNTPDPKCGSCKKKTDCTSKESCLMGLPQCNRNKRKG